MHRLYGNTTPFYKSNLNIWGFWYQQGSWNQSPVNTEGRLYIRVELVGHMVAPCLIFEKLPKCFLKWPYHFTFSPAIYENSNFSTSSWTLVIIGPFDYSHPSGWEVALYFGFDFLIGLFCFFVTELYELFAYFGN